MGCSRLPARQHHSSSCRAGRDGDLHGRTLLPNWKTVCSLSPCVVSRTHSPPRLLLCWAGAAAESPDAAAACREAARSGWPRAARSATEHPAWIAFCIAGQFLPWRDLPVPMLPAQLLSAGLMPCTRQRFLQSRRFLNSNTPVH